MTFCSRLLFTREKLRMESAMNILGKILATRNCFQSALVSFVLIGMYIIIGCSVGENTKPYASSFSLILLYYEIKHTAARWSPWRRKLAFELLPEQVAVHVGEADWGYFIVKYRSPLDETIQSWSSAGLGIYESCVA